MWLQRAYSEDPNLPKGLGPGGYEYLVGEMLRRLYDFDSATQWLSRCLNVGGKSMLPRIRQLWEDAWEAVRQGQQPEEK